MNKLRKDPSINASSSSIAVATSRTMAIALQQTQKPLLPQTLVKTKARTQSSSSPKRIISPRRPPSEKFQNSNTFLFPETKYWALRALSAEAQLQQLSSQRDDQPFTVFNYERNRGMEVLMKTLLGLVLVLSLFLVFTLVQLHHVRLSNTPPGSALHFTIPILSPFTSVVEHETSVVGSKTIALGVVLFTLLGACYFFIRNRFRVGR